MSASDQIQLVRFRVGGHDFAIDVFQVERILRYAAPSPLPKAPDFLEGLLAYAGGAVPVVDLRRRLNLPAAVREETRILVVEWDQGRVGMVVDAVVEVLRVPAADLAAPPPIVRGLAAEYITGLLNRDGQTIVVLAAARLLTSTERLELDHLRSEAVHE